MQKTATIFVFCFLLTQQYLLSEGGFNKPPLGGLAGKWQTFNRRPLTQDERDEISKFRERPANEAIPALSWLITGRFVQNDDAVQVARETILAIPGWADVLREELDRVGYPKTPVELFGPDWDVLVRRKRNDESLPERERHIVAFELYDKIMDASRAVTIARKSQIQILDLAAVLDRPESVLLMAPYLFDTSPRFKYSSDQWDLGIWGFADSGLRKMSVPDKPVYTEPKDSNENTRREYFKAWREWWLRHARDYGATPPPSIDATPAEVAALNTPVLLSGAVKGPEVKTATPPVAPRNASDPAEVKAEKESPPLTSRPSGKIFGGVAILAVLSALAFIWRRRK